MPGGINRQKSGGSYPQKGRGISNPGGLSSKPDEFGRKERPLYGMIGANHPSFRRGMSNASSDSDSDSSNSSVKSMEG